MKIGLLIWSWLVPESLGRRAILKPLPGKIISCACAGAIAFLGGQVSVNGSDMCDWKMPGLNGRQVYELVSTKDRSAAERFIFMTGDMINEKTQQFLRERKSICLSKPFSVEQFRSAVIEVLNKSQRSRSNRECEGAP